MPGHSKKWLIAAGIILLALATVPPLLNHWVKSKIENILREKTEAPNRIGYGNLEVRVLQRKIRFDDADIEWRLKETAQQLAVDVSRIEIGGIRWWPLVFSKKLSVGEIILHAPAITLSSAAEQDSLAAAKKNDAENPGEVKIGQVTIRNGSFRLLNQPFDTASLFRVDSFETALENLSLSPDGNGLLQMGKARATFNNLHLRSKDNLYDITLRQLSFSKEDSLLQLAGFQVNPRFDKRAFAAKLRFKKSRLDVEFPDVALHGWQFDSALQGRLVARSALLDGFRLHVFDDLNLPLDSTSYKPFPQESLLRSPMSIRIDTVRVNGGRIEYEALGKEKTKTGTLVFEPVEAVLTNVTNDSARIRQQPLLEATVTGYLMKKHRVDNRLWFDLSSPAHAFTYKGDASAISFSSFNPFFQPSFNLAFESGIIRQLHFKANADRSMSSGTLDMQYEDLKFNLLNSEKKKVKLLTGIVDLLFVKAENKREEDDYRRGEMYVRRVTYRSFYWFWWNSIQSGITTSILSGVALDLVQKDKEREKRRD